jgi:hypothetical protein
VLAGHIRRPIKEDAMSEDTQDEDPTPPRRYRRRYKGPLAEMHAYARLLAREARAAARQTKAAARKGPRPAGVGKSFNDLLQQFLHPTEDVRRAAIIKSYEVGGANLLLRLAAALVDRLVAGQHPDHDVIVSSLGALGPAAKPALLAAFGRFVRLDAPVDQAVLGRLVAALHAVALAVPAAQRFELTIALMTAASLSGGSFWGRPR